MAFSNRIIKPLRKNKPHVVFIGGYWRVSAMPKGTLMWPYWSKAHNLTNKLNHDNHRNKIMDKKLSYIVEIKINSTIVCIAEGVLAICPERAIQKVFTDQKLFLSVGKSATVKVITEQNFAFVFHIEGVI